MMLLGCRLLCVLELLLAMVVAGNVNIYFFLLLFFLFPQTAAQNRTGLKTSCESASLYRKCKESLLSLQILEARWRLFGHILRRNPQISANKTMEFYFINTTRRPKGRPVTTLPSTLNADWKRTTVWLSPKTQADFEEIKTIAQDRKSWKFITTRIRKAAEESKSMDSGSERN